VETSAEGSIYKTILVPLDGSRRAEAILGHVEELAQRYRARVILLRVVEPVPLVTVPETAYTQLHQQELERRARRAESYLVTIQGEFREKGIKAEVCVDYVSVVEAIIETAQREDADLIAMASQGRSGLSRVFYGSVAAGVLHRVDRPLLLVRSRD
jgi:nucleotide-binding universal stress UspA family protein